MLFPANVLFLLALWNYADDFSNLRASTGVFYFVIFDTIYILMFIEYNFLKLNYEFDSKLIFISSFVILISFIFKKKIEICLMKIFKLKD